MEKNGTQNDDDDDDDGINCRRRPKGRLTTCESPTILAAMAKQVITSQQQQVPNETTTLLSNECTQYLQSIEAADKFSNAPNAIDQSAWNHLCRMRRSKIEMEFKVSRRRRRRTTLLITRNESKVNLCFFFKVRYAHAMSTDAELALTTHNKVVGLKRSSLNRCENKLLELKEQKVFGLWWKTRISPLTIEILG